MDSNDQLHVVYPAGNLYLYYAYRDAAGWHATELVNASGSNIPYVSLAVDQEDHPHISYWLTSGGHLYKHFDGISWSTEVLSSSAQLPSIAIDSQGFPHITSSSFDGLDYAHKDGSGWHYEVIDETNDNGTVTNSTAIAITPSGGIHISYFQKETNYLKHAFTENGSWQTEIVDQAKWVGPYPAPALDNSGFLHVSYHDEAEGELKFAYEDPTGWHFEVVHATPDQGEDVGAYTSLALDENGFAHISYKQTEPSHDLMYAFEDAQGWHIEVVDAAGLSGAVNAISLDSTGKPHISFLKENTGDLVYAFRAESGWFTQTVASSVGYFTSIALDQQDYPHIGYTDYWTGEIRHGYLTSTGWHTETVDTSGGGFPSIAIDSLGFPHISYFYDGNDDLKYAYQDAAGWHIQTVDSDGSVGTYTSLALDGGDYPHLAYRGDGNLKYAFRDESGWHFQVLDDDGDVGLWAGLALDGAGHPHITYYDQTNYDLKYASIYVPSYKIFLPMTVRAP
jgi:hypothetical protein